MKKILSFFITIGLIVLVIWFWNTKVKSRLKKLDNNVSVSFNDLQSEIDKRYIYMDSFLNFDSLASTNSSLSEYIRWKESGSNKLISLKYLDQEYVFDSLLSQFIKNESLNKPGLNLKNAEFKEVLNRKASTYNSFLKAYFQYDLFPKSIIANNIGIEKKKYFELRYGMTDVRPSVKYNRTAKKIDSLLSSPKD